MTLTAADPVAELEARPWWSWLAAILPNVCGHPFADHHQDFWEWVWSIEDGDRPESFVGIWARGGAKSSSAEAAVVALGVRGKRRYCLYVCDTQDRADDHLDTIGTLLEGSRVEMFYPDHGRPKVGKFGNSRGWRRNRLRTAGGFIIDAIGLDTAARGVKLDDQRPDLIVLDDIDGAEDTPRTTAKKIRTLTKGLIPAGSDDVAVLAIQNLVNPNGVFARLADGRADFLTRRRLSGPIPALRGMTVDADGVVHGEPTWVGQDLERCRLMVADMGLRAFRSECQHEDTDVEGALWCRPQIDEGRRTNHPELEAVTVAVDPSGGDGPDNDEVGIVAVGRGDDGHGYVLADRSDRYGPGAWGRRAILLALDVGASRVVGEKNYGGEMVRETCRVAVERLVAEDPDRYGDARQLVLDVVDATRGKAVRAQPIADMSGERDDEASWPQATFHMVGHLPALEGEMCGWDPDESGWSPNRLDAMVWAARDVLKSRLRARRRRGVVVRGADGERMAA